MPRHINDLCARLRNARRKQFERQMRFNKSRLGHFGEELIARHRDHLDEIHLPLLVRVLGQKFRLHLLVQVQMEPKMERTCALELRLVYLSPYVTNDK